MIDQEILDFIANDSNGRVVGETHIANLKADIERTKRSYDYVLRLIEDMLKDKLQNEFEKLQKENRGSLETQIREINEEIKQVQNALNKRKGE
jgi:N-methylhydantoinase B/oxoprolinase/acetone carboxylase alpha subunit